MCFFGQANCEVAYSHISINGHEIFHKRYLSVSGKEFQEAANLYGVLRARYFQRVLRFDGHVGYALRTNECGIFADRWISKEISILRGLGFYVRRPKTQGELLRHCLCVPDRKQHFGRYGTGYSSKVLT